MTGEAVRASVSGGLPTRVGLAGTPTGHTGLPAEPAAGPAAGAFAVAASVGAELVDDDEAVWRV